MSQEIGRCPRCGGIVNQTDTTCGACQLNLTVQENPAQEAAPAQPPPGTECPNCHSVGPATTRICPNCGYELYLPGYSPTYSWPPAVDLQPASAPQPPLITSSRAGDITVGVISGLISLLAAIFTIGISLVILVLVAGKRLTTHIYFRRGVFYGFGLGALVYLSAFIACVRMLKGI